MRTTGNGRKRRKRGQPELRHFSVASSFAKAACIRLAAAWCELYAIEETKLAQFRLSPFSHSSSYGCPRLGPRSFRFARNQIGAARASPRAKHSIRRAASGAPPNALNLSRTLMAFSR